MAMATIPSSEPEQRGDLHLLRRARVETEREKLVEDMARDLPDEASRDELRRRAARRVEPTQFTPPAYAFGEAEARRARDMRQAIRGRPAPWTPPLSTLIWGGLAIWGKGMPRWGVIALLVLGLGHWILKRKGQWQYLYPEEIPDGESRLHLVVFLAGWGVLAFLWGRHLHWW